MIEDESITKVRSNVIDFTSGSKFGCSTFKNTQTVCPSSWNSIIGLLADVLQAPDKFPDSFATDARWEPELHGRVVRNTGGCHTAEVEEHLLARPRCIGFVGTLMPRCT